MKNFLGQNMTMTSCECDQSRATLQNYYSWQELSRLFMADIDALLNLS